MDSSKGVEKEEPVNNKLSGVSWKFLSLKFISGMRVVNKLRY